MVLGVGADVLAPAAAEVRLPWIDKGAAEVLDAAGEVRLSWTDTGAVAALDAAGEPADTDEEAEGESMTVDQKSATAPSSITPYNRQAPFRVDRM